MEYKTFTALNRSSRPLSGATVNVYETNTTTRTAVFNESGGALTQPLSTDTNGNVAFAVANGLVDVVFTSGGDTVTFENVRFFDASDQAATEETLTNKTISLQSNTITDTNGDKVFLFVESVADLLADASLTYTAGSASTVEAGNIVRAGWFRYEVAASAATDQHLSTAGGIKLYALPDEKGDVYTSQLGFAADGNITSALATFIAGRQTGIDGIRQDATYEISGPVVPPATLKRWASDDYETILHGETASRTLKMRNLQQQRATANSETRDDLFQPAAAFMVGGISFEHDGPVDLALITGTGNSSRIIDTEQDNCGFDRCKFDLLDATIVRFLDARHGVVSDCYMNLCREINLAGDSDYGRFSGNFGVVGFIPPLGNQTGDFIKTDQLSGRIPKHCIVTDNSVWAQRDFFDGTGGAFGWVFSNNIIMSSFDFKALYDNFPTLPPNAMHGATVTGNVIYGPALFTTQFDLSTLPEPMSENYYPQGITFSGNVWMPNFGTTPVEVVFFKGPAKNIVFDGEVVHSFTASPNGTFDASVETQFPADGDWSYQVPIEITGTGTIDGLTITSGEYLIPTRPILSRDSSVGWTTTASLERRRALVTSQGDLFDGTTDQGSYDASTEVFPGGSGAVSTGDKWSITTAGRIDSVQLRVGDTLMAKRDIADASASDLAADWFVYRGATPEPKNIAFRNITMRGEGIETSAGTEGYTFEFDHLEPTSLRAIDLQGKDHSVKAKVTIEDDNLIRVTSTSGFINLDLDVTYTGTNLTTHNPIDITGSHERLSIDGSFQNVFRFLSFNSTPTIQRLLFGTRRGVTFENVNSFSTGTLGSIVEGIKGYVFDRDDFATFLSLPSATFGNFAALYQGKGNTLAIASGAITAQFDYHLVDTESAAATDDLATINGGAVGDVLTISAADGARTVVAKDGTGNLTLGADRSLDEAGDTLVLRKYADGNWHQIEFFSVT